MDEKISISPTPPPSNMSTPPSQNPSPVSSDKKNGKKELLSTLAVIVLAPIFALLLTVFVFQSYEVDGPSMETTLDNKDRLVVNKLGHTVSAATGNDFIPKRNDIIVFNYKSSTSAGTEEKQLIKRVIGLPGDRIVIRDGKVTVYNDEYPEGLSVDSQGPQAGTIEYTEGNVEQTIKEGQVFVLGDNRKNSLDSRSFGAVDSDAIVGSLAARIYPLDKIERF